MGGKQQPDNPVPPPKGNAPPCPTKAEVDAYIEQLRETVRHVKEKRSVQTFGGLAA